MGVVNQLGTENGNSMGKYGTFRMVFVDCKCWLEGISDHLVCLEMGTLNFADLFDMTIYDGSATVE